MERQMRFECDGIIVIERSNLKLELCCFAFSQSTSAHRCLLFSLFFICFFFVPTNIMVFYRNSLDIWFVRGLSEKCVKMKVLAHNEMDISTRPECNADRVRETERTSTNRTSWKWSAFARFAQHQHQLTSYRPLWEECSPTPLPAIVIRTHHFHYHFSPITLCSIRILQLVELNFKILLIRI